MTEDSEEERAADFVAFLRDRIGDDGKQGDSTALESGALAADAPKAIGPYKILEQIGEGGMGVVYLAEQTEPIRRRVALKIIKIGMDTKAVVTRFAAEQQALALMDHPCVAKVLDAGATDTGRPYFVMEHVAGVPITEHCDRQRLGIEDRLKLFMQVCDAVQHAHQKGIIHRDLKPSNILISVKGGTSVPKVIDFGVAKALHQRLTEQTLYTEQGQLVGTPEYMSPEQAEMTAQDIDTRSDIYSLGVLLYELLTGERPFSTETLRLAGLAEIQRTIREEDPPKPSTRLSSLGDASTTHARSRGVDPTTLSRSLRGDLDWIVMKCLEKDRERRYETATGLAEDLRRHLDHEPVQAGPPSARYRLGKFVRRNRLAASATGAILVILLAGITIATWGLLDALTARDSERRSAEEAVAAREEAVAARVEAEAAQKSARRSARNLQAVLRTERVDHALVLAGANQTREAATVLWPELLRMASVLGEAPASLDTPHPHEPAHWRHVVSALRGVHMRVPCVRAFPVPVGTSLSFPGPIPDAALIATIDRNSGAEWTLDVMTGEWMRTERSVGPGAQRCVLAPSGELMAYYSADGVQTIRGWAPGAVSPSLEMPIATAHGGSGAMDADARMALTVVGNRAAVVDFRDWSTSVVAVPEGIVGAALIPNREEALLAGAVSVVRRTLRPRGDLPTFEPGPGYAKQVLLDLDGGQVFTNQQHGIGVTRLDAITSLETSVTLVPLRFGRAHSMAIDVTGRHLCAAHYEGDITVLDLDDLSHSWVLGAGRVGEGREVLVPAPNWLVSGGEGNKAVRIWDLSPDPQVERRDSAGLDMHYVTLSRDGRLRAASVNGDVGSENARGFERLAAHSDRAYGLVMLGASDEFVTVGHDGRCLRWRAGESELLVQLPGRLWALAASTDGLRVAVGGEVADDLDPGEQQQSGQWPEPLLEFIDLSGRTWMTPRTTIRQVMCVAFEPGGARVVACGYGSEAIESWSLDESYDAEPTTIARIPGAGRAIAWSPDGAAIAVGHADGRLWIVDPDGIREERLLGTHASRVHALAFSPVDSSLLVSGSGHGEVRLWDVEAGVMLGDLLRVDPRWRGRITDLEFTRDGRGVLLAGDKQPLGIIRLDYFDTYIAGNLAAWLGDQPDAHPDGAAQLREWAEQQIERQPHPLWSNK